jgi:uncharacterized protein with HEPN domain
MAIDEILEFFSGIPEGFEHYQGQLLLKRATERNLEIIGEAINRILKEDPEFPIEDARQIIGLRNIIIHGYDMISDENIYDIVTAHLPTLKKQVDLLIAESGFDL